MKTGKRTKEEIQERKEAMRIINLLTIDELYQYFNDEDYLRECMAVQYDSGFVSIEYLRNLID